MSLVNLAHVCSHLQNASRARLGVTSIPATKLHMHLAHQLQKSGFISTVTLGGLTPPPVSPLLAHPPAPPLQYRTPQDAERHKDLSEAGKHMKLTPTERAPYHAPKEMHGGSALLQSRTGEEDDVPVWELMLMPEHLEQPDRESQIPANPAQRKLWLGMKYWNNEPVLKKLSLISKPKRRIWMASRDFEKIAKGKKTGYVEGMMNIGEAIYVTTDLGIMEIRECIERGVGGMLLCRAW